MCEFIHTEFIAPGWGCCRCRTYNGLQRVQCQRCGEVQHTITVPDDVVRCKNCGFGFPVDMNLQIPWQSLEDKMQGERPAYLCPACDAPMGPLLN